MDRSAPILKTEALTKQYGTHVALDHLDLTVHRGEVFGYIGPNGAGKSTTLKILAGLVTKYDGAIRVAGTDIKKTPAHALIGFMPQSCGFQNWRTVDSALDSLGELSGVPDDARRARIPRLLERFDLLDARYKKVKELSGGMTQKLGLIQALLHEPRLLVLDEPLEGLDPPSRNLLKEVIRERRRAGTTVLFSSHILSDVEDVADRIGILHRGKLATSGSIRELVVDFGLPTEIEVAFATPPSSTAFLAEHGTVSERKPDVWSIRLAPAAIAADDAIVSTVAASAIPTAGTSDGASTIATTASTSDTANASATATDPDAIIHAIIERTLATNGRIRKIGIVEPDLDDLFAEYILRADRASRLVGPDAKSTAGANQDRS
jgi:ABC-2 type transport system ATP-binding protein